MAMAELDTVLQYLTTLVEHQTYLTVAIGQSNSILVNLEENINECTFMKEGRGLSLSHCNYV